MTKIVEIALEPLTADAFAPYGQLIAPSAEPPSFEASHLEAWQMDFAVDGEIELMYVRYIHQKICWTTMERHFNITQSFMAVPPIYLIRGASRTPTGPPALVMAPSSL